MSHILGRPNVLFCLDMSGENTPCGVQLCSMNSCKCEKMRRQTLYTLTIIDKASSVNFEYRVIISRLSVLFFGTQGMATLSHIVNPTWVIISTSIHATAGGLDGELDVRRSLNSL